MKVNRFSALGWSVLTLAVLLVFPLTGGAGNQSRKAAKAAKSAAVKQAPEPTPEQIQKEHARLKAENKKLDQQQREAYLRSRPFPGSGGSEIEESDVIKMHAAREWYLLTYPTGRMPSMPWDRARRHVGKKVKDAEPWPGPPLRTDQEDGTSGRLEKALVAPGFNTWVSYGPQPLDSVGTTNNAYRFVDEI